MKRIVLAAICLFSTTLLFAQSPMDSFFKNADAFLHNNVENGRVAYSQIAESPAELESLVKEIGNISLADATPNQKKAFYINSYNILTINSIVKNGIPASPLDVEGFFSEQPHLVAGKKRTLDGLEKETLFPAFPDARIHFVVVCAAKGCPPIRPYAYLPENLDQQIHEATVSTLNSDYFIRVKPKQGKVLVSEIFKWYQSDFLADAESVLAFINQFRKQKINDNAAVDYYTYDWSLNIQE